MNLANNIIKSYKLKKILKFLRNRSIPITEELKSLSDKHFKNTKESLKVFYSVVGELIDYGIKNRNSK